jgi:protein-S-isoprenylcysteine O-methyltransferase Ste14
MSAAAKRKSENYAAEHAALMRYQGMRRFWLAAAIAVLGAILLFASSAWENGYTHNFIEAFGTAFIGVAIMGRLWCTLYIGGRKAGEIVSAGPYSVMRNPLYFFSSVGAIGVGAQSGSILIALVTGMFCAVAFTVVIRREERFLSGQFGAVFDDYMARVPRFFPNPRLFRDEPVLEVLPARMYSTFVDGLVFFVAVPAFEVIEYLQETGVVPVLLHLY